MRFTIQVVDPETRSWEGPKGPLEFISGQFTNGDQFSIGAKPENVDSRIAELTALVGQEGDFDVEARPEYQGVPQWKLKTWPGKPTYAPSTGGGGKASWYNSEDGVRFTQDQMNRRTAIMTSEQVKTWSPTAILAWLQGPGGPSTGAGEGEGRAVDSPRGDTSPSSASSPSVSTGAWGEAIAAPQAKGVGNGHGEGPDPALLAALIETYGTKVKALKAGRIFFHDHKPEALSDLSDTEVQTLIDAAHRPL